MSNFNPLEKRRTHTSNDAVKKRDAGELPVHQTAPSVVLSFASSAAKKRHVSTQVAAGRDEIGSREYSLTLMNISFIRI